MCVIIVQFVESYVYYYICNVVSSVFFRFFRVFFVHYYLKHANRT